ncbi:tyrosine-type recombinase/integrase [Mycobacteroides abscessus]|uniref:tyrosine-type recombinase/integrase n=1 Tax=Mycobacteroides abscessus TaxID=36809 RepID=UPI00031E7D12|nr:tyrosine-type recombinase/integrase [Mycobacteroides abscessus]
MTRHYSAERTMMPGGAPGQFVVIDGDFEFHAEACRYLGWLRAMDRSPNTERVYAGRVARFLTYCESERLDWRNITARELTSYLKYIVTEPFSGTATEPLKTRFRTNRTANAHLTTVCEFLRFAVSQGWVAGEIIHQLSHRRYLRYGPPGYDSGEDGQFREIRARSILLRESINRPETLDEGEVAKVVAVAGQHRDVLLVSLLFETGMRIGEALGLRREDMHLLSNSASVGCRINGPHLHVRRRMNQNGACAKSRAPRSIPVTQSLVQIYVDYLDERSRVAGADTCDYVFVNIKRAPFGAPMKYHNAKKMFERASKQAGLTIRPHMLRHTAATRWLENGTPRDVVQALLGHVSLSSLEVYSHPSEARKREAVDRVDGGRYEQ